MFKKLINDIKEFNKFRKRNFDTTIVNCRINNCKFNDNGLCISKCIILNHIGDDKLKCIYSDF